MAEPIQSPVAGSIRGIRRNVSSGVFTGRPVAPSNDTISDNIIAQNSLSLNNVSQRLENISTQVGNLTFSLNVIKSNLAVQTQLDQQREAAQTQRERQAAQQGLRKGKESTIERTIQNALFSPLRVIGKKARFSLGRLTSFFTILLSGWIGDKLIKAYGFLADGNKAALNKLGRSVLGTLGTLAAILVGFKLAFKAVLVTLGVIGLRIGRFGRNKVFIGPIRFLGNLITRASIAFLKGLKNPFRGGFRNFFKPGSLVPKRGLGNLAFGTGLAGATSIAIDTASGKPLNQSVPEAVGGMTALTVSSILTRGMAMGDWRSKILAFLINSAALNFGVNQVQNFMGTNQDSGTGQQPPQPSDGNIMPSLMSPITDQDLLNEIKSQKPNIDDFGPGKSGTIAFEKAMMEYNDQYGDRIKTLESRIEPKNEIKEIKNLRSKRDMDMSSLGSEPDMPPLILPLPTADNAGGEAQQGGVKGGAATGYPVIPPSDLTNSHIYLAMKMFNISPALG